MFQTIFWLFVILLYDVFVTLVIIKDLYEWIHICCVMIKALREFVYVVWWLKIYLSRFVIIGEKLRPQNKRDDTRPQTRYLSQRPMKICWDSQWWWLWQWWIQNQDIEQRMTLVLIELSVEMCLCWWLMESSYISSQVQATNLIFWRKEQRMLSKNTECVM